MRDFNEKYWKLPSKVLNAVLGLDLPPNTSLHISKKIVDHIRQKHSFEAKHVIQSLMSADISQPDFVGRSKKVKYENEAFILVYKINPFHQHDYLRVVISQYRRGPGYGVLTAFLETQSVLNYRVSTRELSSF